LSHGRFDEFAAGATFTNDVLLSLKSTFVVAFPPANILIRNSQIKSNKFLVDFQDTTANPVLGFLLLKEWPLSGLWAVGTLVGINLLFAGFSIIAVGSAARALAKRVS
jgi:hypothetical protein